MRDLGFTYSRDRKIWGVLGGFGLLSAAGISEPMSSLHLKR
jgi:hypothetical protein